MKIKSKDKITMQAISNYVGIDKDHLIPEHLLILDVIYQALKDISAALRADIKEPASEFGIIAKKEALASGLNAKRYLNGHVFQDHCTSLEMNAVVIQELLKKAEYL